MQHHHGGWRTIVDSTIVEGTIRKHQEGRCEKGSYQKGIAFALLCNRIYVKNKVSDQSNPKWYKASLPRESHELHQSLGFGIGVKKICPTCSLSCQDLFLLAEIAVVESWLPRER
jgi:hypothetical protein